MTEEEIAERVADRLKVVSLPGFEDRMPSGLSGGQKKRASALRALRSRTRRSSSTRRAGGQASTP